MITRRTVRDVVAAAADLAFGSRCAGCDAVPGTLCDVCAEVLLGPALEGEVGVVGPGGALPDARPGTGLPGSGAGRSVPLAVTTRYEGVGRAVVIAHKERGRLALAAPLGAALAVAVTATLATVEAAMRDPLLAGAVAGGGGGGGAPARGGIALVPAPSRRSATRARGHDPMLRTARQAARVLRRAGAPAAVVPALTYRRPVADQHDLGRADRFANVRGAIGVRHRLLPRLVGRPIVIVDDVVTTGATVAECWRALHGAGTTPVGAAAITAVGGLLR